MPQPALTVFLIIAAIAIVVVLIAVIVIALRAQRRRKLAQTLEKRRDDEVQYAFIVNPSKPQAEARRLHIQRFCEAKGLNRIRFYDTQLDKDGRVCALEALEDGADVVIAVGGDGTVRTVASAVSGTGHALGIIPIGTGNLFARNMGVPVDDIDAALTVATSHGSRLVDMGRLTLLDHPEDDHGHAFLIIAGIGFDAAMIDDTNPELKANISWLAYSWAREEPVRAEVPRHADSHQRRRLDPHHQESRFPHGDGRQLRPDSHVLADAGGIL